MRENFIKNFKAIEKAINESKSVDFMNSRGFSKAEMASFHAKVIEIATQAALSLEELELKSKASAMELEKVRCDMELSTLNAKAQIRIANSEVVKQLIQAATMIRSVSDNAKIQQANAMVGFLNVVGNATNSSNITTYASGTATIIKSIDTSPMTAFDETLKKLIDNEDDFGSKDVIIHASKTIINVGEFIELKGISTYGQNKTKWLINDELSASNTKNFIFEATSIGEFKICYAVLNSEEVYVKDEVLVKVIEGELTKEKPFIKKL